MHFAVHGNTAAEVIVDRANHRKPNMGLSSWKNAPNGKIVKAFAESEFEKYRVIQDSVYKSDFDKFLEDGKAAVELPPSPLIPH